MTKIGPTLQGLWAVHNLDGCGTSSRRNLRDTKPEDFAPQAPEPRRLHFKPDNKEKHHDAEFGGVDDRLRIGEETKANGL